MGEEKEILLRGKVCAYLTCRLMGDLKRSRYGANCGHHHLATNCSAKASRQSTLAGMTLSCGRTVL